ncbi:diaminopimelate epimerase [uncultured Bacteroides sp.]|uniref:diaminopimelate epimerase n=1 Tax=uncultured Bacteroides sp. TaxID=162156 RepID=UPI002AAAB715|nr:diaminopimelate epimerase [uncultured Bacteroides sp.]
MTNTIRFTKMHGAGNDYIYVNTIKYPIEHPEELAIKWSAFHTGIGSDGLVLIGKSPVADFSMRIFNADGSEAMMCGNASRCIGKYLYDNKITDKKDISLDTLSGIKHLQLTVSEGKVSKVTVDMGSPKLEDVTIEGKPEHMVAKEITINNQTYKATAVSMGNPHLVIYINDIEQIDLPTIGPLLERHPLFPGRINVEFAQKLSNNKVRMRVWERGSGITMACGTGACATAVAGSIIGETGRDVEIIMDGGSLNIKWDEESDKIYMTGDAVTVFEGEIAL